MRRLIALIILLMFSLAFILSLPGHTSAQAKPEAVKTKQKKARRVAPPVPYRTTDTSSRLALVIGNSSYDSSPLKNPANDASDMASTLQELGFTVILKKNATLKSMEEGLEEFGNRLKRGGVGLFYYAGHGLQMEGTNYLIPIGAKINKESDVKYTSLNAGKILDEMAYANNGLNIVIMDACRDNPYVRNFRSATRGLADISNASLGTFIACSTSPGQVARDGDGRNSPYTSALLEYIKYPGLSIEQVFKGVRQRLIMETGGKQISWDHSSLQGEFYFNPPQIASFSPATSGPGTGYIDSERQKLEQERLAVESERKKIDEERARTEAERRKADEERARTEAERRRADEERARTEAERRRADEERARTEAERRRADEERKLSEEKIKLEAQQRALAEEKRKLEVQRLAMAQKPAPVSSIPRSFTDSVTGMEFVLVKGGCFQMGDTFGDGFAYEKPVHEVCVSDFYIGKYEVTQGQWKAIMGNNPSHFSSCGDTCPVEKVSWNDIQDFIQKLNSITGKSYCLPTEAEWEYAARSGGKKEKYAGTSSDSDLGSYAWYTSNSGSKTHPVGQKSPNSLGLYDMSGNVWEWVSDYYDNEYYKNSPRDNPHGPASGSAKVLRGGGWNDNQRDIRASDRSSYNPWGVRASTWDYFRPSNQGYNYGFRVASSPR
ncbi:MAG: SUMF1/EgtB/PvdO family nonheme iron enzyme [Proteobacteria bacterium]|nr:SUMF1/EgtB/PvdO family nonheme iron enzyme [Pseudomonadota bacterium]